MIRRRLLGLLAAGSATTAGCIGADEDDSDDGGAGGDDGGTMTQDDTTTTRGIETVEREDDFETVAGDVRSAIEDGEMSLLTVVHHAENAASADEELPPTRLFVFGNPEAGTPLMRHERSVALDLPQKMLVWDEDGQTRVAYNDPEYVAERHGLEGHEERLGGMAEALRGLATAASRPVGTGVGAVVDRALGGRR